MISQSHSPSSTKVACNEPENDNPSSPPLSPKRSFAFTDEGDDAPGSPAYFKRRHVRNQSEPIKRVPLDPLSASEIKNRPRKYWDSRSSETSFHSLDDVSEIRSHDASISAGTEDEVICSWPPVVQSGNGDNYNSVASSRSERPPLTHGEIYSSDARESCRTSAAGVNPAWPPPSRSRSDLSSPDRRTSSRGWDVDKTTQPVKSLTSSIPYVRPPLGDLWKAESSSDAPVRTVYGLVDDRDSILHTCSPPGLAKRRGSEPDETRGNSWSLSLASDSQPLRADESSKFIAPIGAERSRVMSMSPRRSKSLPPAGSRSISESTQADDSTGRNTFRLKSSDTPRNSASTHLPAGPDELDKAATHSPITKDEFDRLLRQALHNKHTSKVFSPLSPIRNPVPNFSLTINPVYQRYFPSLNNRISLRYTKGPDRRFRNLCDLYQLFGIEMECTHCQECKRDTIGKRLLASRYLRERQNAIRLLTTPITRKKRPPTPSSYIDEDEKSLWEEVAAVTSSTPFPSRPHLQDLHDFEDEDDYPEIPDEDLISGEEDLDVVVGMGERRLKFK